MEQQKLIEQLESRVSAIISNLDGEFSTYSIDQLNDRPLEGAWSALECFEHLNRYCEFYLPEIQNSIDSAAQDSSKPFSYTWLGKKSIASIHPNNTKKTKTFKRMNPTGSSLKISTLQAFKDHQVHLLALLKAARKSDITKKGVRIEFMKFMKLNTGEALEFVITHQERHLKQAEKAVELSVA